MTLRRLSYQALTHVALAIGAIFVLAPFVLMLVTALRPPAEVLSGGLWPSSLTLDNFDRALSTVPWLRYYSNGLIVTVAIFAGQVLVCAPAAWALARLRFRGREASLWLVLACLMIPPQATAIPVFLLLSELSLLDTRTALIIPFIGSAFGIFLFRQFLLSVPQSLIDAARLDGVGEIAMTWRLALPLLKPALVAFGVFSFTIHWNDLFWPYLVLRSGDAATVPYGVARFATSEAGTEYAAQMAAAVLAIAPLLMGFLAAQRQFAQGVTFAGIRQ